MPKGVKLRMDSLPIEKLLTKIDSVYKLVILASRRTAELTRGAPPLIKTLGKKKVFAIALEEILQGKVSIKSAETKEKKTKK